MQKTKWIGGIYVFSPHEESVISDFIDFYETGGAFEDIFKELDITIFPLLKRILLELKETEDNGNSIPPFMGNKRSVKA